LGRASNTRSENKNLNLETDEFASTPPFSKKAFGGSNFAPQFWRELFKNYLAGIFQKNIWREFFKKYLAGTFKTHIWREQFQKHIWREHFGGNILRETIFFL
jgi:hypothetical protein